MSGKGRDGMGCYVKIWFIDGRMNKRREKKDQGKKGARIDALMAEEREKRRERKGRDGM